jgi:uncharacterized protein YqhQ
MGFHPSFNTMRGPMMDMATYGGIDSMLYSREGFQTTEDKDKNKKTEPKKSSMTFYIILFITSPLGIRVTVFYFLSDVIQFGIIISILVYFFLVLLKLKNKIIDK